MTTTKTHCSKGHDLAIHGRQRKDRPEIRCFACWKENRLYWDTQRPLQQIWRCMIQRCTNPKNHKYPWYGGRKPNPITVCSRWLNSYEAFEQDMGPKPSPRHTLDRIKNEEGYEPNNCQWANPKQQARNRRSAKKYTFQGETLHLTDWADRLGFSMPMLHHRLNKLGWSIEDALTRPRYKRKA